MDGHCLGRGRRVCACLGMAHACRAAAAHKKAGLHSGGDARLRCPCRLSQADNGRLLPQDNGQDNIRGLQLKLKSLLVTDARTGVDFFAGFTLPVDAMDFTGREAADLVRALAAQYECCIVDADSQLNGMLTEILPCVQWLTVVSDGTSKSNQAMVRLLESLKVLGGSQETNMNCEVAVLYSRFGSQAGPAENVPAYVRKLGQIPRYGNALQKDIVTEISKGTFFDALDK